MVRQFKDHCHIWIGID